MIRISTILLAIFSVTAIYAQDGGTVESDGYKGKVKSVTTIRCDYTDEWDNQYESADCSTIDFMKYNSDGKAIEEREYDYDGILEITYTYKYDSEGNPIEFISYSSDGSEEYKETYKYDSDGNNIELIEWEGGDVAYWKTIYQYDSNGNMIKETFFEDVSSVEQVWRSDEYIFEYYD